MYALAHGLHTQGSHTPTLQYVEREKGVEMPVAARETRTSVARRSSRVVAMVIALVAVIHPLSKNGVVHCRQSVPIVPNASLVTAEVPRCSIPSSLARHRTGTASVLPDTRSTRLRTCRRKNDQRREGGERP